MSGAWKLRRQRECWTDGDAVDNHDMLKLPIHGLPPGFYRAFLLCGCMAIPDELGTRKARATG